MGFGSLGFTLDPGFGREVSAGAEIIDFDILLSLGFPLRGFDVEDETVGTRLERTLPTGFGDPGFFFTLWEAKLWVVRVEALAKGLPLETDPGAEPRPRPAERGSLGALDIFASRIADLRQIH